ncbi:energy transducer TonB [Rheinheimera baltica]|uniref:Energy transducer TonB n=1 Tax=Rheinheimera baltica TaxID=67576 RepID=A0ABT9HVN4_9GAMM|nr:energy transducer TonB [Rheinheimera baltica]MDP5135189.1 energy transducer TonB [Rheinheimera baltica]
MVQLRYSLMLLWCALSWQAHADFPTAKSLFEQQEYALAKPQLETLAELGHLEAQFLMSRMYAEGLGVEPDVNLAYAWALIARERNHPLAEKQYRELRTKLPSRMEGKEVFTSLNKQFGKDALDGNLYPTANRYVVKNNRVKVISQQDPEFPNYFERAGVSAWAVVHYDITEDGITDNINIVASFPVDAITEYVQEAVQSWRFEPPKDIYGDAIRLEMQSHTFQIKASSGSKSRKFDRENEEYLEAILAAAKAESAKYQYLYGLLIENRIVTDTDALSWYLQAAINGYPQAQYKLAQCLVSGNGCDRDQNKAVNWLAISADSGDPKAAYLLAQELLDSNNVNYNPRKAAGYLEVAALKEYMPAIAEYAALLAMSDDPTLHDPQKAIRLAEQGRTIDANNPNLLSTLGVAFIELGQQGRGESMLRQAVEEARKRNWTIENFEDLLADYQTAAADNN